MPLVLVMTKMDQCRLDAPRIEKICSSFMAVSSRELGIKVFVVDATNTFRVKGLFRSLIQATLDLGAVATELRDKRWEEERQRQHKTSRRRRKIA